MQRSITVCSLAVLLTEGYIQPHETTGDRPVESSALPAHKTVFLAPKSVARLACRKASTSPSVEGTIGHTCRRWKASGPPPINAAATTDNIGGEHR